MWADEADNSGYQSLAKHVNMPGDGIFDRDTPPTNKVEAAIGVLDLSATNPQHWGFVGSSTEWTVETYRRYFSTLHAYRTGELQTKTLAGGGSYSGSSLQIFTRQFTNYPAVVWRTTLKPSPVELATPFDIFYDFKVIPHSSIFWSARTNSFALFYLQWESYQTDQYSTRLQNPLLSGTLATAPWTPYWNLSGYVTKTFGQLWQQTVSEPRNNTWCVLYGDPTIRLRSSALSIPTGVSVRRVQR